MKQPEFKLLRGQKTSVMLVKEENRWGLIVVIMRASDEKPFLYSELKVRAFDDAGREISVQQAYAPQQVYISSGHTSVGNYILERGKGRKVASIELSRGGEKLTFSVAEETEERSRK